jgi:hypothetical protein
MAGSYEKLVKSQDLFLSTQQSGETGSSAKQEFNSFKACFNQNPLVAGANQFLRMSLTQFFAYRNFYYVNNNNNKIIIGDNDGGGTAVFVDSLNFASQDYADIEDIGTAFGQALANKLTALAASHSGFPTGTWTYTSNSTLPTATGGSGTRRMEILLTFNNALGDFQNLVLQCPQYTEDITTASATTISDNFNDSYALLGGKRISDSTDKTSQSFDLIFDTGANTLSIVGYYPMQRTTTPYLYLRSSYNGNNLETQNLNNFNNNQDNHMINSTIIAKLAVSDNSVASQFDALSPYFVDLEPRYITELDFRITDHHGRSIPLINGDADTNGNLFYDMTLKVNTYENPPSPFELQTSRPPVAKHDTNYLELATTADTKPNPYWRQLGKY